eukprot:TRINITY_DN12731_c8_g1_i1.p1 TRINITY_DN12731_c8_g1~~TRINITY_DN12731_c8_g1_i1.p1  ORF type:complete len:116 (-),score=1.77 TRINITY_DN12731_c8_g1_i1:69-416(-)
MSDLIERSKMFTMKLCTRKIPSDFNPLPATLKLRWARMLSVNNNKLADNLGIPHTVNFYRQCKNDSGHMTAMMIDKLYWLYGPKPMGIGLQDPSRTRGFIMSEKPTRLIGSGQPP